MGADIRGKQVKGRKESGQTLQPAWYVKLLLRNNMVIASHLPLTKQIMVCWASICSSSTGSLNKTFLPTKNTKSSIHRE